MKAIKITTYGNIIVCNNFEKTDDYYTYIITENRLLRNISLTRLKATLINNGTNYPSFNSNFNKKNKYLNKLFNKCKGEFITGDCYLYFSDELDDEIDILYEKLKNKELLILIDCERYMVSNIMEKSIEITESGNYNIDIDLKKFSNLFSSFKKKLYEIQHILLKNNVFNIDNSKYKELLDIHNRILEIKGINEPNYNTDYSLDIPYYSSIQFIYNPNNTKEYDDLKWCSYT